MADLEKLERIWRERQLLDATEDRRPADRAVDNAWAALQERLTAYARLPVDKNPKAPRAREILDILFPTPEGLSFLKLPYEAEWAESDLRLGTIDTEGLATDMDVLAGDEFLVEVRRAHKTYGQVLGITEPKPAAAQAESLREPLLTLGRSLSQYSFAVLATVDRSDDATIERAKAALAPFDEFRSAAARREKAKDTPSKDSPETDPTD